VAADFNADGVVDLVVINGNQPTRMYFSDPCPDGFAYHRSAITECHACPAYATDASVGASVSRCRFCPGGTVTPARMRSVSHDKRYLCIPCAGGKHRPKLLQVEECVDCSPGRYSVPGESKCRACEAGRVTAKKATALMCDPCPEGTEPSANRTVCQPCAGARFSTAGTCNDCFAPRVVNSKKSTCTACLARETTVDGHSCVCEEQLFNTSSTRPACHAGDFNSDKHTRLKSTALTCETCAGGEHSCVEACRGDWVRIKPGWSTVRHEQSDLAIFKCTFEGACPGGNVTLTNDAGCNEGYEGPICATCATDFTLQTDGSCEPCSGDTTWQGFVVLFLLVVILVVVATQVKKWYQYFGLLKDLASMVEELNLKAIGKILVATLQIIGNFSVVLNVQLPENFAAFLDAFVSFFRFDISGFVKFGCFSSGTYVYRLSANLATVVFTVLLVAVLYVFQACWQKHADEDTDESTKRLQEIFRQIDKDGKGINLEEMGTIVTKIDATIGSDQVEAMFRKADKDGGGIIDFDEFHSAVMDCGDDDDGGGKSLDLKKLVEQKQKVDMQADAFGRFMLLTFLLYPGITNKIFEAFACRDLGHGMSYLHVDYTVNCESSDYTTLTVCCYLLVILWPFGVPFFLAFVMNRERQHILDDDEDTLQKYAFVLGDYKKEYWYWEVVELARKLVLSGLMALVGRGSIAQSFGATIISFMFFSLTFKERPYESDRLNFVKIFTEFQIFFVLLVCVVLQTHNTGFGTERITVDDYGLSQVLMVLAMFPITIYFLGQGMKDLGNQAIDDVGTLKGSDTEEQQNPMHNQEDDVART
jgi:hypothetical protein